MDKAILEDYIDACEQIRETEKEISALKKKRKTIIQTNVSGSNPDFPYEKKHFKIQGTAITVREDSRLRQQEKVLEERKENAERLKQQVEEWLNMIPNRMQRIIRYKIFEGKSWEQVATKIGRKATGNSVRMEFERFMKNN